MNKFKVSLLFLICIFIYSTDVWSQNYPEPPITYWNNKTDKHFIPASPTATELGKYGGIPVSYYTGMPQINIELYKGSSII